MGMPVSMHSPCCPGSGPNSIRRTAPRTRSVTAPQTPDPEPEPQTHSRTRTRRLRLTCMSVGLRDPFGGELRVWEAGRVVGHGEVALSGRWVDLRVQVPSAASAERVFEVLTDWPRHREWMPFTRAEGGQGVGAVLTGWTGLGPLGFADTMVVTEWVPGRRVAVRHTGRLVRGDAWFGMEPAPSGGSRITWVEHIEVPLGALGRVGWAVVGPVFRRFMRVG